MDKQQQKLLLEKAKKFFREEIVTTHIKNVMRSGVLKEYTYNPFLITYVANFLKGDASPRSIAEALIYPRVLGTSISTSFGMKAQKMITQLFEGMLGSSTTGMDVEFIDAIDGRKKYCQVKAGPQTINHDDVKTIIGHFAKVKNLARQNHSDIRLNDLVVGILYGERNELSTNYQDIEKEFPVIIGKEFWHRLTGSEAFYPDLINAFGEVAKEVDGRSLLEKTIESLAKEIEQHWIFK